MAHGGKKTASVIIILLAASLAACATTKDRLVHADQIAHQGGLTRNGVPAGIFTLTTYSRISDPAQPINFYIEGDGLAWLSRTRLSPDPTPQQAIGLSLAALDPSPNVVYLARPCQFVDLKQTACDSAYWSDKRYSKEVIDSMNRAVDFFVRQTNARKINLIGYSGGGAVAVLLAACRHDVSTLRTVAGNLDHEFVNRLHHVSPMPESLNPIDVSLMLSALPQLHFVGADDSVIPQSVAESFVRHAGDSSCIRIIAVKDATHDSGWRERWPTLLKLLPNCITGKN
ncbi:MAG TPA: alpha/beta hydrolase [Gammaproteobacteria bacterium]|nr:alpha/beta hydrolase [Gammaproteobacteria bacterium]